MKIFRVGGSVRDALLGLPVKDVDYVVLGSTPEQMVAAGFTPVGKDFPVFIHPQTRAEYALARTERKSAPGYHGFIFHCAPDVTIEQDLQRRDLTINAMAVAENSDKSDAITDITKREIIDPFGGQRDLAAKLFRHVSDAFSEDPVRILRVARFAARFNTFSIALETMQLMRNMVQAGEVDALVPERVWQEIARGFMETQPSRMIDVLHESGTLMRIMPELAAIFDLIPKDNHATKKSMDQFLAQTNFAAKQGYSLSVRWAAMLVGTEHNSNGTIDAHTKMIMQLCARLKVPTEVRDVTLMALREHNQIEHALSLQPEAVVHLFERCDAFRRPERFAEVVRTVHCHHINHVASHFPQQSYLAHALNEAKSIPNGKIAQTTILRFPNHPQQIAHAIFAARVDIIKQMSRVG